MLLRHRAPRIETRQTEKNKGLEHLDETSIGVLRWLNASRVDYVLIGPVAEAIRGNAEAHGPVTIVPAPYRRNFERLARALWSAHARLRVEDGSPGQAETVPIKMTADKLSRGQSWALRCGAHDVDIEGRLHGVSRYQELLYEAGRFSVTSEVSVEVASPEDIEHCAHVRRTGSPPEIRIMRATPA
jgi:hypothetical protein